MPDALEPTSRPRRARLGAAVGALALLGALSGCVGYPGVVPPPGSVAGGYGYTCYAGFYTCTLPAQGPAGAPCSCPGIGAPSYGTIR